MEWTSPHRIDPTTVALADKVAVLGDWSGRLLDSPAIDHVVASLLAVAEDRYYADTSGTRAHQQRVRVHPQVESVAIGEEGDFESMRTLAPPVGKGWEYVEGDGWDWNAELEEMPDLLEEKVAAPDGHARPLRPGHRSDQPVAHHPRIDRPRDRARSCPRL